MNVRQTYVGIYDSPAAALSAQQRVEGTLAKLPRDGVDGNSARVEVLLPGHHAEPLETREDHHRAGWSLVRCHLMSGAIGLGLGALVAAITQFSFPAMTIPAAALWTAALFFGLVLGMMAGGAFFLRPPAGLLWAKARDESRAGRWQVVATLTRSDAADPVAAVLKETARETYWAPGRCGRHRATPSVNGRPDTLAFESRMATRLADGFGVRRPEYHQRAAPVA